MTQTSSDRLQDYIDTCGAEAEVEIEEAADKLGDTIHGFVFAGEYGFRPFRSWSSVSSAAYFWQLVRKYTVDVLFMVIMSTAFVVATVFETNPSIRHTAQVFFAVMAIMFAVIIVLEIRLQYNFFKRNGYPLKHTWDIRDNAVRMIGVGEKFIYSAYTKPSAKRIFAPNLVVDYEPYSDISRVDIIDLPNRKALSIVGTKLGLDVLQDPDFSGFEKAVAEIRSRIENNCLAGSSQKTTA